MHVHVQNAPDQMGNAIDYFPAQMKQAETEAGKRLIDVLDLPGRTVVVAINKTRAPLKSFRTARSPRMSGSTRLACSPRPRSCCSPCSPSPSRSRPPTRPATPHSSTTTARTSSCCAPPSSPRMPIDMSSGTAHGLDNFLVNSSRPGATNPAFS